MLKPNTTSRSDEKPRPGGASAFAASKLAKNSVGATQIKKGAVVTAKIKNAAVTNSKLADNAVTSGKIADGEVRAEDLGTILEVQNTVRIAAGAATLALLSLNPVRSLAAYGLIVVVLSV